MYWLPTRTHAHFLPKKYVYILTCESQFIFELTKQAVWHIVCRTDCAEVLYVNAEARLTHGVQNKYAANARKNAAKTSILIAFHPFYIRLFGHNFCTVHESYK